MSGYEIGTVFDLYDDDPQRYMVINNLEKENNIYLLASPVQNDNGMWKIDYSKTFLLNVDKATLNIEYETNQDIANEIVMDLFNKGNIKFE